MPRTEVTKEVLPNGLTILVAEDHTAPVVAINLWVRAGYFDEVDLQAGISHVIEHMFFKGTPDRPRPDQIATEIKALGGELNAGTYYDSTNYYVVLPAENYRKGLEIHADALMHPLIDPEELKREIEAVIQEGRRKIDNPSAYALEMMFQEAFEAHRMHRWRIGSEEGLRAMTRDDLLDYFHGHYVPGRVILAIVGDVSAPEAIKAAHLYLGGMPGGEGAPLGSPPEPPQTRFKYRRIRGDIKRGYTVLGYHTPPVLSEDDFALRVLAHLLGSGRSSRLFQAVKEKAGLVDTVGASLESFRDIGVLTVLAEGDPRQGLEAARAIQAEIERLRREPPAAFEIERARTAIEFRYHQSRSEVLGQSSILAYYEALGGYALADESVERLSRVTAADVRRVAETHLQLSNATLLEYLPEGAKVESPDLPALVDGLQRVTPASPSSEPPSAPRSAAVAAPRPPSAPRLVRTEEVRGVQRHRFEPGPVLLHEERRDLPLVTFCAAFRGGRSSEGRENTGITRFMQATMVKGSVTRDARQVALEIEGLGSAIERLVDEDYFGFGLSILSKHARRGIEILLDLIRRPAFRHEEIEKERAILLAAQESIKDQSMPYSFQLFRQAAFGSHPYALPSFGHQVTVQSMKREDLVKWHRATVRPAGLVVTVVGDIGRQEAIDLVAAASADWITEGHGGKDPGQLLGWGASEVVETRRRRQTAQVIGFPTPGLQTPERFPLDLVQVITSGLGGRFFEEVRGKRGLAYAVHAFNYHRVSGGAFAVYLATAPKDESEARRVLFQEIARLRREGPHHEELERAIRFTRGMHAIAMQGNSARAFRYVDAEVRGTGVEAVQDYPDNVAKVGYEEVTDAIWRYLDPDRCALGIMRGDEPGP
ncbi:MAG TPA: pitrilysin family protein [Candidatus Polarisedimenticolia bacterium]|nr:pitrilysin family protein [Candidatus Polarisedimenticolia bacterium]